MSEAKVNAATAAQGRLPPSMKVQVMDVRRRQASSRPSWKAQVHAEHAGKGEGKEHHDQERQQEEGRQLEGLAQQRAIVHALLLALVVMPLDGEEHAGAEYENLEHNEDYRDPIDHFENFQPMALTLSTVRSTAPDERGESVSDAHTGMALLHVPAHST